jgi:protein-disulfide isomerase
MTPDKSKKKAVASQPAPSRPYLVIGAGAVIGIAILLYLVMRPKDVSVPADVTIAAADTAGFRGYLLGSETAPVEISEYADYQCPACGSFEAIEFRTVKLQLIDSGLVRWRYRDFPIDEIHRHARLAAHAAACADDQGKYWEVHGAIYQTQAAWSAMGSAAGHFRDLARQAGLNIGTYDECMESTKYAGRIQASFQEGAKLGVASTPSFLIGGRIYRGVLSSDTLVALARSLAAQPATSQ